MRFSILAVLLGFVLVALPARGQTASRFGVKAGLTASELHNDGASSARWGGTASVFVTQPFGAIEMLGEAGYHEKGLYNEFEFSLGNGSGIQRSTTDFRIDYAFLLVAPHYKAALGGGPLDLFAFAGPRLDIYLNQTTTVTVEPESEEDIMGFADRDFRPLVLGVAAGAGLDASRWLGVPLLAELRYNGDLTASYTFSNLGVRNRTFDLRLGFTF